MFFSNDHTRDHLPVDGLAQTGDVRGGLALKLADPLAEPGVVLVQVAVQGCDVIVQGRDVTVQAALHGRQEGATRRGIHRHWALGGKRWALIKSIYRQT